MKQNNRLSKSRGRKNTSLSYTYKFKGETGLFE
jgi:hypothetical protein